MANDRFESLENVVVDDQHTLHTVVTKCKEIVRKTFSGFFSLYFVLKVLDFIFMFHRLTRFDLFDITIDRLVRIGLNSQIIQLFRYLIDLMSDKIILFELE